MFHKNPIWTTCILACLVGTGCSQTAQFSGGNGTKNPEDSFQPHPDDLDQTKNVPTSIAREFPATSLGVSEVVFLPEYDEVTNQLTLQSRYEAAMVSFRQEVRALQEKVFTQGTSRQSMKESFRQTNLGIVDILVVVDNSGSMKEEHDKLKKRLPELLSYLDDADWRVGIVSTDARKGCLQEMIEKGDNNPVGKFERAIDQLGINGHGNEVGILKAVEGLDCKVLERGRRLPWLRENSNVGVLIVSDEDNCSDGNSTGETDTRVTDLTCFKNVDGVRVPKSYRDASYLTNHLAAIRPSTKTSVFGIMWDPATPHEQCAEARFAGVIYKEAITKGKGLIGSICDASYGPTMEKISKSLFDSLKASFSLKFKPRPGTLRVTVDGTDVSGQVDLTGQQLTFRNIPPINADIQITYDVVDSTLVKDFKLGTDVEADSLEVRVNDRRINDRNYEWDAAQGILTFDDYPADSATIQVTFKPKSGLKKDFELADLAGAPVRKDSLRVSVNGRNTNDFTFNSQTGRLSFPREPDEGAAIEVKCDKATGPILRYPMDLKDGSLPTLQVVNADDPGMRFSVDYQDGHLIFKDEQFREGATVRVTYRAPDSLQQEIALPQGPMAGSVVVDPGKNPCKPEDFEIKDQTVSTACPMTEGEPVTIRYQYPLERHTSFTVDGIVEPDAAIWTVYVDQVERADFVRQGSTISFAEELPLDAKVLIAVTWTKE